MLAANPDLRALFVQTDQPTIGAARHKSGRRQGQVLTAAFDGIPEFIELPCSGELLVSGMQQPYLMGQQAADALLRHLDGDTPEKLITVPIPPSHAPTSIPCCRPSSRPCSPMKSEQNAGSPAQRPRMPFLHRTLRLFLTFAASTRRSAPRARSTAPISNCAPAKSMPCWARMARANPRFPRSSRATCAPMPVTSTSTAAPGADIRPRRARERAGDRDAGNPTRAGSERAREPLPARTGPAGAFAARRCAGARTPS